MRATLTKTAWTALAPALAAAGLACLAWWALGRSGPGIAVRVPGLDDPYGRKLKEKAPAPVRIGESFTRFDGAPSSLPGEWPGFRGPLRDNLGSAGGALADRWGAQGPPVLWSVALGEGYAAAAVRNGRVYVLDYDEEARADALRCLSLDDGREIWRRFYRVAVKRNHGMSRTIPAVTDRYVVSLGPLGHVMCADAVSGDFLWGFGMAEDYGARVPNWYAGQCPAVDGDLAVLAPAGTNVLMMGVDCATGRTVWTAPNPGGWQMSHSSVATGVLLGRKMHVYAAIGGLAGVAADGADAGRILWRNSEWTPSVIAPTPVLFEDGRIFATAGYGAGSAVFQVSKEGDGFAARLVRRFTPREGLSCEQQTPIAAMGRLFGILTKDAGPRRNQFACADLDGNVLWTSGPEQPFGMGPFMLVDGRFLILDDRGVLTMAEASPDGFRPVARADVLDGTDSWGPLALAGTRLILRDSGRMICLEMGVGS